MYDQFTQPFTTDAKKKRVFLIIYKMLGNIHTLSLYHCCTHVYKANAPQTIFTLIGFFLVTLFDTFLLDIEAMYNGLFYCGNRLSVWTSKQR